MQMDFLLTDNQFLKEALEVMFSVYVWSDPVLGHGSAVLWILVFLVQVYGFPLFFTEIIVI